MSTEAKKTKILAAIEARGWFTDQIYWDAALELKAAGLIKLGTHYFPGGNRKPVWIAT